MKTRKAKSKPKSTGPTLDGRQISEDLAALIEACKDKRTDEERFRHAIVSSIIEDAFDAGELAERVMPKGLGPLFDDTFSKWLSQELMDHRTKFKLADLDRIAGLLGD